MTPSNQIVGPSAGGRFQLAGKSQACLRHRSGVAQYWAQGIV